jgi:hypothetical protein
MVPHRRGTHGSPDNIKICRIAVRATSIPAIVVHSPKIKRIPHPAESRDIMVVFIGGSVQIIEIARKTSAEPTTTRMRSKPTPGQPPANVEYRRRKERSVGHFLGSYLAEVKGNPQKSCHRHSLEFCKHLM